MDLNENVKEEVNSILTSIQRLLPRKKRLTGIKIEPYKPKIVKLSHVHNEAKNVFPQCFMGTKLVVVRQIIDRVKLVQQYNYGTPKDSYRCFTQLIQGEQREKQLDRELVLSSPGSATATYCEVLEGSFKLQVTSKIRDLICSETEVLVEKDSESSVGVVSCSMKDVDPNTLEFVTQWMYQILPEFYVGTEVGCKPLVSPPTSIFSISARYEKPSFALSTTVSKNGFQVCMFKMFSKDLRLAAILNEDQKGGNGTFGLGLHKNYENGTEVKMFIDSQKCGGFTVEKDVYLHESVNDAHVIRLIASTLIDRQRRVRFGFGFNLDF